MPAEFRARSFGTAVRYRGRVGMWTWILHRVTGLGVLLFLIMHVVDTGLLIWSPDFYDHALSLYKNPVFRFGELFVFFGVLYHATNGLRIIIQDFWPYVMQRQRQMAWGVAIIVAVAMIPVTWIMVAPIFGLAQEPGTRAHVERCRQEPDAPACLQDNTIPAAPGEVVE
ncbi:MAG TPA: succinate dehydrogenase, cytochrome b556 subunit [Longimicrobiaceae bacterium]|nr:succinate dehydrogenase, cytochrome b556 subunit [Longimicrobiaceae bacterium]